MTNDLAGCGGGGWTLAMKIDGDKVQQQYNSPRVMCLCSKFAFIIAVSSTEA